MKIRYDDKGRTQEEFLAQYKPRSYEKPSVTVDILVLCKSNPMQVLLIKRKQHPYIEQWAFPGGFVNMKEDIEAAAHRELKEETGVEAMSLHQLHTYGSIHRDPRMRVISIAYLAIIKEPIKAIANDDAKDARWFRIHKTTSHISLQDEQQEISIVYALNKHGECCCTSEHALAFDHVYMLLDALTYLKTS